MPYGASRVKGVGGGSGILHGDRSGLYTVLWLNGRNTGVGFRIELEYESEKE